MDNNTFSIQQVTKTGYKCKELVPEGVQPRRATVVFENYQFVECRFEVWNKHIWTLEDWRFVGEVAEFIKSLTTK